MNNWLPAAHVPKACLRAVDVRLWPCGSRSAVLVFVLLTLMGSAAHSALAQSRRTEGTYTDSSSKKHAWYITSAHALMWDDTPYVPTGGDFQSGWLAAPSDESWKHDTTALQTLKAHGVLDVLIDPIASAADVSAASWQRLTDYLEAGGFRYGVRFGAGIQVPLTGTVVKPGSYRIGPLQPNEDATWQAGTAQSARYVLVSPDGAMVVQAGQVIVHNGFATVGANSASADGSIGLLYPRKSVAASAEGSLPDLWAGYDTYRDHLLATLSKVKFGPGLRCFVDPLAHRLGLYGEDDYLVPDSPEFRLSWEAWLARHYESVRAAAIKWRITDGSDLTFKSLASLVPLWADRKGTAHMLDTATSKLLGMDGSSNLEWFWQDLREFRNQSTEWYMNAAARFLKHQIADVPVIYTYTPGLPIFDKPDPADGFDGLGVAAYGRGSELATGGADAALSDVESAPRGQWLVVTETRESDSADSPRSVYASEAALTSDLDWLRGMGSKGFYVAGLSTVSGDSLKPLTDVPTQLDWIHSYAGRVAAVPGMASELPVTLPYPESAAGIVHSGPIGTGAAYWVPSIQPGMPLAFGNTIAGYEINRLGGRVDVLWSLLGPREVRLLVNDPRRLSVLTADGRAVATRSDIKKHTLSLTLTSDPVVVRGMTDDVFPVETAEDTMKQLNVLLLEGEAAGLPVDPYRLQLSEALRAYKVNPTMAYGLAAQALNSIAGMLHPYNWVELEAAKGQSFGEPITDRAASGGAYLSLSTQSDPPDDGYSLQAEFTTPSEDTYTLWLAASPPGAGTSPFAWVVDAEGTPHVSTDAVPTGLPYLGGKLVWLKLGQVAVRKGPHTFTMRVTSRAAGSGRYQLAADCLMVTRSAFTPQGTIKPPLATFATTGPMKIDDPLAHGAKNAFTPLHPGATKAPVTKGP